MCTAGEATPIRGPQGGGAVRVAEADSPSAAVLAWCKEAEA
jgi:hypothetical protein